MQAPHQDKVYNMKADELLVDHASRGIGSAPNSNPE